MSSDYTNQPPITPPPELIDEWVYCCDGNIDSIATQAARWGADQQLQLDAEQIKQAWQKGADAELEACCEWLGAETPDPYIAALRSARRPKPQPTFKELALKALDAITTNFHVHEPDAAAVRRALEQLND